MNLGSIQANEYYAVEFSGAWKWDGRYYKTAKSVVAGQWNLSAGGV